MDFFIFGEIHWQVPVQIRSSLNRRVDLPTRTRCHCRPTHETSAALRPNQRTPAKSAGRSIPTGKTRMSITVKAPSDANRDGFCEFVNDCMAQTLARLSNRITKVNVTLTDENGPRGGVDKQCRVTIVMPGLGQFTASARHENPLVAVRQAANRARRIVLTKLRRPKSLRVRRRVSASESADWQANEEMAPNEFPAN